MSRRKAIISVTNGNDQTTINGLDLQRLHHIKLKLSLNHYISILIANKYSEFAISSLVIIYSCIAIVRIAFDIELINVSTELNITELIILSFFALEASMKIFVLKYLYFKSWINSFDIIIIGVCFIVIIFDLSASSVRSNAVFKLAKVFRIFRLLLMLRKATDMKLYKDKTKIKTYSVVSVCSPSDNVLAILGKVINFEWVSLNEALREELVWCYDIIKSRKLYEVNIISDAVENNDIVKMGLEEFDDVEQNDNFNINATNLPLQTLDSSFASLLSTSTEWDFDIFKLETETATSSLEVITSFFLSTFNLFSLLDIKQATFNTYIHEISSGYIKENPYHNATHAADVVQAFYYFLTTCDARKICSLNEIDTFICILSAAIHDFQHPGFNNLFLVNSNDLLAIRYNDKSVLENHHLAASFSIVHEDGKNIFENWTKEIYKKARMKIISLVLATDFSRHFADIGKFQSKLSDGLVEDEEGRLLCMEMLMHTCDVSNPSRPWDICKIWADKVMTEFFIQGDKERELGLPISHLCDRYTVNIPKSQIGFMDLFIEPTFNALLLVLPKTEKNLETLHHNKKMWSESK